MNVPTTYSGDRIDALQRLANKSSFNTFHSQEKYIRTKTFLLSFLLNYNFLITQSI